MTESNVTVIQAAFSVNGNNIADALYIISPSIPFWNISIFSCHYELAENDPGELLCSFLYRET